MKTLNLALTALIAVVAMTGCGKNNDSNNGPLVNQSCLNGACGGGIYPGGTGAPLAIAVGTSQTRTEQMGLQFNLMSAQAGHSGGSVTAQGVLDVAAPSQLCGLLPGRYTVSTQQPGIMSGSATINQLVLVAQGPTQVQIVVPQIQINYGIQAIGQDGTQYSSTMYVQAYVNPQSNNYQCAITFAPRGTN